MSSPFSKADHEWYCKTAQLLWNLGFHNISPSHHMRTCGHGKLCLEHQVRMPACSWKPVKIMTGFVCTSVWLSLHETPQSQALLVQADHNHRSGVHVIHCILWSCWSLVTLERDYQVRPSKHYAPILSALKTVEFAPIPDQQHQVHLYGPGCSRQFQSGIELRLDCFCTYTCIHRYVPVRRNYEQNQSKCCTVKLFARAQCLSRCFPFPFCEILWTNKSLCELYQPNDAW